MRNQTRSTDGRYSIAWGKDHACGWFIQVYDLEEKDEDKSLIVDKDELFNALSVTELISIAVQYNAGDAVQQDIYGI